ncbi:ubiquinone/menaquinone biosynthesis-related protein [Penicillium riverlandense]|uniref:ubiquinone/menaquinone biosynthesis-related protein n=1 Tax=Penicillium riverlandense TaxID=1903569 RepID=UPI0025490754|nr:ubiquinone/menaquinone biosynthesis-related protein [Penicillium riverlandense]KAJ5808529.1 ubiquinone/menaquinone biosynthesis-related protein [Penicillium riverlandense]
MNTIRIARVAVSAPRWSATSSRGAKTKARPQQSYNPPAQRRTNPHLERLTAEQQQQQPKGGISPRVLTAFAAGILGIGLYCGLLYTSYKKEVAKSQSLDIPQDVSDRYNDTASGFDADVETSEKVMRIGAKRKALLQLARGNTLEVSCGTGRNLEFYELGERRGVDDKGHAQVSGCRSVTFVDLSPQMVEITRRKFESLYPDFRFATFRAQDAGAVQPPATPAMPYYDTIVQTMGLCSMPDPVATLRHLGSITEPRHGRILLLEHGRSHYDWVNRILDNLAAAHADRHGCWWNRDIGEIIRESGLEVVEEKRYHLGTTYRYVLRPKS